MKTGEWIKAAKSSNQGACVEVFKTLDGEILVRDSKNRHDGLLVFTTTEWDAFVDGAKNGEFDL